MRSSRGVFIAFLWAFAAWALVPRLALAQQHEHKEGEGAQCKERAEMNKDLPKCPITDEPVDFYASLATDDGPIYFCCLGCTGKYKAKPQDYAEKVAAQRAALAKRPRVQVTCPVRGEPVDMKVFVEKNGQKVYFCCNDCKGKYEQNPAQYKGKLAGAYWYQTKCPVMGEDIDPKAFADLPSKQRVYFCCKMCDPKFAQDPDKYAEKLGRQGYWVDVAALKKAGAKDAKDTPSEPKKEKQE